MHDDGPGSFQVLEQCSSVRDVAGAQDVQCALSAVNVVEIVRRPVNS
jgi:hypothetical protein